MNRFLFGRLCLPFGYNRLNGRNKEEESCFQVHLEHGAIPTITVRSAEEIENPAPQIERMLRLAGE